MIMSNVKAQMSKFAVCVLILISLVISLSSFALASDKWGGVDESVVEKYAEEHGREARDPFINTDQGDLLLFVFLLGGAIGGFIGGYYWRELMEKAPQGSGASERRAKT
jgi:ABC-type cobalt transport system substrate-binding protein